MCEHRWGKLACQLCGAPLPPNGMCRHCGRLLDDEHRWRKEGEVEAWLDKPICPQKVRV